MPLVFSGETGANPNFEMLLEAFDGYRRVVVVASLEAVEDQGLEAVQQKASEKYDANLLDRANRIKVATADL